MNPARFKDPIGIAGGLNLYGYAGGDPVNFSDPFGLCEDDDEICQSFVTMFRSFSAESGDAFDRTAEALDKWKGGRFEFVTSAQLGDRPGETTFGLAPNPARGRNNFQLNANQGAGETLVTVAHEAAHLPTFDGSPRVHNSTSSRTWFYNHESAVVRGLPAIFQSTLGHWPAALVRDYRLLLSRGASVSPPPGEE